MEALEIRTGKGQIKNIKVFFYCLVTVFVAVTFLSHIYLSHPHDSVAVLQSERSKIDDRIENLKDSLLLLSVSDNYKVEVGLPVFNEIRLLKEDRAKVQELFLVQKAKVSLFGFPSPHKFLWHFGVGLVIFILSLDMLRTLVYFKGNHRKARTFGAFTALTISGYYMAWIFYPENDLPKTVYLHVLLAIGVLSGLTGIYIASVKRKRIITLKFKLLTILTELKNGDIKSLFKIAIKSDPYNEAYQLELKESSRRLTKKMQEDADEILHY